MLPADQSAGSANALMGYRNAEQRGQFHLLVNRYIERAENCARFIEVNLNLSLDLPRGTVEQWEPLVATTGDHEIFVARYGKATKETALHFLVADAENQNFILSCLLGARENARSIKEIIPSEMWEQVNRFYLMVRDAVTRGCRTMISMRFWPTSKPRAICCGESPMPPCPMGHFARLGRLLERADKTSRILDVKYFILLPTADEVGTPFDIIQWSDLLKSASALEMYYKRYGRIAPDDVAAFLILEPTFPRAIRYCLIKVEKNDWGACAPNWTSSISKTALQGAQTLSDLSSRQLGRSQ